MTDEEKMIDFFKHIGMDDLKSFKTDDGLKVYRFGEGFYEEPDEPMNTDESFHGYAGFYCDFVFDQKGKYVSMGFYE